MTINRNLSQLAANISNSGKLNNAGLTSSYTLPIASNSVLGGVKVDGSTITINATTGVISGSSTYSLPTASTSVLGGVKVDGSTITINATTGVISGSSTYSLPTASTSVLGGVKVGTGLSIDSNTGILSTNIGTGTAGQTLVATSSSAFSWKSRIYKSTSTPTNALDGDIWVDYSTGTWYIYVVGDGTNIVSSNWVEFGRLGAL